VTAGTSRQPIAVPPLRIAGFHYRIWHPATRTAGLEGLRIHDLRHTAVALWIAAGASLKEVAVRAGHSSVSFTLDRYGHLYPESDTALRDRLDAIFAAREDVDEGVVIDLPPRTPSLDAAPPARDGTPAGYKTRDHETYRLGELVKRAQARGRLVPVRPKEARRQPVVVGQDTTSGPGLLVS
jgi:Phage integrase family